MNIENLNRARNAALAAILAAGLSLPATGLAYAADGDDSSSASSEVKDKLNNLFLDEEDENVPAKSESVYVFANADGSVKNTVVTNWLKNPTEAASIHDISSLANIQNTEGKETFEAKGQSLVWDAQGNDIYYQGDTDKKAPVALKVTYWLDGKETAPADMAGKSGHVKIRFDYDNKSSSVEYVDGAARTIYTPFACMTGMILDNDVFKNVTAKNAKTMNDGDRTMVGGVAFPGLKDDLDIDDDIDIPDYIEVEADATNFEMATTATLVSSNLLDNLNADELDTSELGDSLGELSDAMGQLIDGTSKLYDGMKKLDDGGSALADGVGELAEKTADLPDSAQQLADGSSDLADGLGDAVDGADALVAGNKQVTAGLNQLVNGGYDKKGNKVSTGLSDAVSGVEKLQEGVNGLATDGGSMDQLAEAETTIAEGLSGASGGVSAYAGAVKDVAGSLTDAQSQLGSAASSLQALSDLHTLKQGIAGNLQATQGLITALEEIKDSSSTDATTKATLNALLAETGAATLALRAATALNKGAGSLPSEEAITGIQGSVGQLNDGLGAAAAGLTTIADGDGTAANPGLNGIASSLDTASAGATTLAGKLGDVKTGLSSVSSGLDQLNNGGMTEDGLKSAGLKGAVAAIGSTKDSQSTTLLGGNNQITNGLETLGEGLGAASTGATQLAKGLDTLNKSVPALTAGIQALKEGSEQLSDGLGSASGGTKKLKEGMQKFNDEGIQKLVDAYNENLAGLGDRLKATVEAGKAYNTFTGKNDDMKGSVKFIYETDAIELPDED